MLMIAALAAACSRPEEASPAVFASTSSPLAPVVGPAWTARAGTTGADQSNAIAVDSTGSVLVSGAAAAAFDGQSSAGGQDSFLTKYSPTGSKLWTRLADREDQVSVCCLTVIRTPTSDDLVSTGSLLGSDGPLAAGCVRPGGQAP